MRIEHEYLILNSILQADIGTIEEYNKFMELGKQLEAKYFNHPFTKNVAKIIKAYTNKKGFVDDFIVETVLKQKQAFNEDLFLDILITKFLPFQAVESYYEMLRAYYAKRLLVK